MTVRVEIGKKRKEEKIEKNWTKKKFELSVKKKEKKKKKKRKKTNKH